MRRKVWLIRHTESTVNTKPATRKQPGKLALENRRAHLTEDGRRDARKLGLQLPSKYGIYPARTPAAVSRFTRARETAKLLGFTTAKPYAELNEINPPLEPDELRAIIGRGDIPVEALEAGRAILRKPLKEDVWIGHALVIAGICAASRRVLIQQPRDIALPYQGEVRLIEI
jgi:hypothetical protein